MAILTNKKWQALQDAQTIIDFQNLKKSPERWKDAKNAALKKAEEWIENASLIKKATGGKITTKKKK